MRDTDIRFECTRCGNCCRDLRLPLTLAEAARWLVDGHSVEVLCEAVPWADEPPASDELAAHKRSRSFAAISGSLPVRVVVVLAASFAGPCPNLRPDGDCGIYERRPNVCGIYPAEINPFISLMPTHKACPPEAWSADRPHFFKAGQLLDARTVELIRASRAADQQTVGERQNICAALGLQHAAMANEGWIAHVPERAALLAELGRVAAGGRSTDATSTWRFVSNRRATVDALAEIGAESAMMSDLGAAAFSYLPVGTGGGTRSGTRGGTGG